MSPFLVGGEVLLHIGPPKTGTTALQHSLAQARPQLKAQGVLYPGKRFSHWTPSCSALGIATTAHPADPPPTTIISGCLSTTSPSRALNFNDRYHYG